MLGIFHNPESHRTEVEIMKLEGRVISSHTIYISVSNEFVSEWISSFLVYRVMRASMCENIVDLRYLVLSTLVSQRVCVTAIHHSHTPGAHADDVLSLITPYLSEIQDIVCVDA